MGHIALSLLAAICIANAAYGELSSGSSDDQSLNCPQLFNPTNIHRCSGTDGSFWCCDKEEFALQGQRDADHSRSPRSYPDDSYSLGIGAIIGFIILGILPFALCCFCCCCACCPWYHMCHSNSTSVTIVQPAGQPAGLSQQNNFCINVPNLPGMQQSHGYTPMPQPPPPYTQEEQTHQPPTGGIQQK